MRYIVILEASDDVDYRIGFADVSQELVPKPLSFRRSFNEAGDIHKLDRGWHDPVRLTNVRQLGQSIVRHLHDTFIRFNGAERVVLGCYLRGSQRIEQGGFADVRQPNNPTSQCQRETSTEYTEYTEF